MNRYMQLRTNCGCERVLPMPPGKEPRKWLMPITPTFVVGAFFEDAAAAFDNVRETVREFELMDTGKQVNGAIIYLYKEI